MNMLDSEVAPADPTTPPVQAGQPRIDFLDGFRGIAILAVIFFHYYSRFASDARQLYPFGARWSGFPLFEHGLYGVQLFFAVSGFVISLTLLRCSTFPEFALRRFARLWPTMLLCACITFGFLSAFPEYWPQRVANFLPSLTFVDGGIYERLFNGNRFAWIDGSYWSLFVEVRFYAIAAVLYFSNPAKFLRNVFVFSLLSISGYWALELTQQTKAANIIHGLLIPTYLPWFLFGIAAHCLWMGRRRWAAILAATAFAPLVISTVVLGAQLDLAVALVVCCLFLLNLRSAAIREIFASRWLTAIGVSSYSLYLLHQSIGVTSTSLLARYWSIPPDLSLGLPLLVAAGMILVAHMIYRYWETPLNAWIVRRHKQSRMRSVVHRLTGREITLRNV